MAKLHGSGNTLESFHKASLGDKIFYCIVGIIITLCFAVILYPCVYVLSASFSSGQAVSAGKVTLLPVEFSSYGYQAVFKNSMVLTGFYNSFVYTVLGTAINMLVTMICAYCLSRKDLPGAGRLMFLFTFTMLFSGGMISSYILIRSLRMIDTRWVMIVPGAMSVYNMIMARTYIQSSIPGELLEASQIDGCSDIGYFLRIVLPLSKSVMAVLVLFYAVGHWNAYFHPMIYLNNRKLFPLTIFMKDIIISSQIDAGTIQDPELAAQIATLANVIKYALIVVSMVPILVLYPWIQKYFVKGVMIGSIKG